MPPTADRRHFEILACLGRGGFGEVYVANMVSGGGVRVQVALKVLRDRLDPASLAVRRLRDEARLLGLLNHPSILRIHDLVLLDDRVTLVTEYVDGADLNRCIKSSDPIPLAATLQVIGRVADALTTAFAQAGPDGAPLGLLHRDVKPSNLRIGRHGEVKLLDFGIAKATGVDREAETRSGAVVGSFPYMAPERFDGVGDGTPADVYSLGAVLFEAIARERLHKNTDVRELFALAMVQEKHDTHVAKRLEMVADAPPGAVALLTEMLGFDPMLRPRVESLGARCEDLADAVGGANLSRWCRHHTWPDPTRDGGALAGRVLTESSLSNTADVPILPDATDAGGRAAAALAVGGVGVGLAGLGVAGTALAVIAVVVVAVGVGVGVWLYLPESEGPEDEPVAVAAEPEPEPDPPDAQGDPADATAAPAVADAALIEDEVPEEPAPELRCGDPTLYEDDASAGALALPDLHCLRAGMRSAKRSQTDRARSGRVVLVDTRARCDRGDGCEAYETEQRYFFEEIDRSDPELLFSWALYLARTGTDDADRLGEAIGWAERALERKSAWRGVDYVRRVDALMEVRAQSAYARWKLTGGERHRIEARNASADWMNQRIQLGRDPSEALALCSSAVGSEEVCRGRMDADDATVAISLLSVPVGAEVVVDGEALGRAPVVLQAPHGTHTVQMRAGDASGERAITVAADAPVRWTWRAAPNTWEGEL